MNSISFAEQDYVNYRALQPSMVRGQNNDVTQRNKRYLYQDLFSVYKFELPELWSIEYFRFLLFRYGSIGVVNTSEYGWVFGPLTWTKLNMYYYPSEIYIWNKDLNKPMKGIIGVNACIINCFDDFRGFDDIVSAYAERMATAEKNININLMNASVTVLIKAKNKKQAAEMAKAYSQATEGKPFVAVKEDLFEDGELATLIQNPSNTFIADKLIDLERTIKNEFLTLIGINNTNVEKNAHVLSEEINANNDETSAIASIVLENLERGFNLFNKLSGENASVSLRYEYSKGGADIVGGDTLDI